MSSKKHSSDFDRLLFVKHMKDIGRAYRKQATELVSICRLFVQVGEQSVSQDAHIRRVLAVVDDALSSAADPKNKTFRGTDKQFEEAINALSDYEHKYHPKQQVAERMKNAKEKDKTSSKRLNMLKESFKTKLVEGPTKVAPFLLPGSLTDSNPNVIKQVICEETNVHEILWNFSRLKGTLRITLKQNPHFYRDLSRSAHAYRNDFTTDPIERFWDATDIWVLTDERSRVFLETDRRKRAFGNFWAPDEAIIFKDVCGRLEGEGIVAGGKRDRMFEDWKQLVRNALNSANINIHITTRGTPPESQDQSWVLSSATNAAPVSPAQSFSTIQARSNGTSSGPAALLRPSTPLPVIPPPSAPPSTLSPRGPSAAAPPSPARPASIYQDSPVAVSVSITVATLPQAPRAIPQRPEQQPASTGASLTSSRTLTAAGGASSLSSATLIPSANDSPRSSSLHAQGGNTTSVPVSVPATIRAQTPTPRQQAESAVAPAQGPAQTQGKKKNWFQRNIWDYNKGN